MDLSKLSDDQLLVATSEHPEAFGVFYERHVRGVLGYIRSEVADPEVALDLTAEVFAAALSATARFRPGEAPAPSWLRGIARNKIADQRRRRARADAARRRLHMPRLTFTDAALERVEQILDAERAGYLEGIDQLPPHEREAVLSHVVDERDYADLAAAGGVSEAAIRQRVSRGLSKLARQGRGGT